MPPKVLVHGTGGIGSIYVYLLTQAGCDVTAVCRSNYSAVKSNGIIIDSEVYGKDLHVSPNVVQTPSEAAAHGPFDYLIVSTKALPDSQTSNIIAPAVTKCKTTIVLIQNGIGIEDEYAARFPGNPLLSCVVYLPTTQTKPGHIQMGFVELLEVGTFPSSAYDELSNVKTATNQFLEILKQGGSNAKLYPDIQEHRWKKLLLNVPWNSMCALTLCRDTAVLASSPEADPVIFDLMMEVVAVAQALGYKSVNEASARSNPSKAYERLGTKGIEPSMLVDVLSARRTEVDVILGVPVKVAKELGVPVPRMEMLYVLCKALDQSMALRRPGKSLCGDELRKA
ncbi:Hypothetical protein R9X50_00607100 [Acrodontium crateriforme]|uniref:2-dehydropantoate 2-reductase n=1 Tax=Acrodontium crateriforme TaxID=150365 RepID=A0AAQ3RBZ0_9PEZI|nr:Hypothetical protein R9X50_00607100 [Acrodontium crateriforme]